MALQSSGQISLSQIATEFGGSAPHSLSEYYGDGNAPASGEIQLAADFYGTSSGLLTTTMVTSTRTISAKLGTFQRGYSNGETNVNTGNVSFGSIANATLSNNKIIGGIYYFSNNEFHVYIKNRPFTGWTTLTLTRGSNSSTISRSQAAVADQNPYERYIWQPSVVTAGGASIGTLLSNGQTTTVVIA
jgi:hypothetical protein